MDGSSYDAHGSWQGGTEPIAIVGAACRLPGAPDLDAFARLLAEGRDAVSEIPDGRWDKAQYFHPARGQRGKAYTFAAGVIGAVDGFDPSFFGISPREATQIDPQQRLMLELAHEAMEDAGIDGARLAGTAVGVYVGGSSWDYSTLHVGDPAVMDAYSMTGLTLCSLANRVSYAFDLRGPSFTVDTACSSSLVALHQACEALRSGQVPAALVGGVSLLLAPDSYVGFCAASMLSPRGRCHAFDARADGYVRAEGGGMVLLKPLRDALAAGDPIRAVIRGTGVNSDGRTTGFSLPNKVAQAALLQQVYGRFDLQPERLVYLEAHGTGTPAGDPIEAGALGEVLGRPRSTPLPIGSVKTNVGHLEAASGMAGLLKAMLVLQTGRIPRSLNSETPNPNIPFASLNLRLAQQAMDVATGPDALVGINSFGFGGTNAHAVLEPAPAADAAANAAANASANAPWPPLLLSARSDGALRDLAAAWSERLAGVDEPAPLLRGAALAREQHKLRLGVLGGTVAEILEGLDAFRAKRAAPGVVSGSAVSGGVVFAFSGNGSQWAGMAQDAVRHSAGFRDGLAAVDLALQPWLGWSVVERLTAADAAALRDTAVAQPLLFAVQVAAVLALRQLGVQPDACMGHSVGEVAAAWAAGALDLDSAARVIAARSRHQRATHGQGGMAVLGLNEDAARAAIAGTEGCAGLEIAACNSSASTTVAGPAAALDALATEAKARGWSLIRLDLDYAFHSAAMDPIQAPLLADLAGLAPTRTRIPFASTVTGQVADGTELDARYWWRNVREPVRFAEAARSLVADGARILLEVGPLPVLQAYLHDALHRADVAGRVLGTLLRRPAPRDPIALAALRCHAAGVDIRGTAAFAGPFPVRGLPHYPWQRERFWGEDTIEHTNPATLSPEHPLLGVRHGTDAVEWSRHLGLGPQPWLADHVVGGAVVVPAAALIDMALAAARARHPAAPALEVLDFEIERPLVLDGDTLRDVRLRVGGANGGFELASRARLSDEGWHVHARGRLAAAELAAPARPLPPLPATAQRRMGATALYAQAADLGLAYGPAFQTVSGVDVLADTDALVHLLPNGAVSNGFLLPPPKLDGALQGLVALAAGLLERGAGVLPWRFGRIRLLQTGGTDPRAARLRITRVGPRSVRADIALLDADGTPVAELLDCWFVRVVLGRRAGLDGSCFHPALVASADPRQAAPGRAMLDAALGSPTRDAATDEFGVLADAFAACVAATALRGVAGVERTVRPASLIALGRVAPESRALLDEAVGWLEADGYIESVDDRLVLLDAEVPDADEILRTLVFDAPDAVADAALLSRAGEVLGQALRLGPDAMGTPPAAMTDQFLHDSPAGARSVSALLDAAGRVARHWPAGQPLRVLHLGARRGAMARRLADTLRAALGTALGEDRLQLVAATGGDDLPALTEALAGVRGASAVAWQPGEATAELGRFDLVVGLYALSTAGLDRDGLSALVPVLSPGGLLVAVEPELNRVWRLAQPGIGTLRSGASWQAALEAAGFAAGTRGLSAASWPASLVAAQAPASTPASIPGSDGSVTIVSDAADPLADAVRHALAQRGVATTPRLGDGFKAPAEAQPGTRLVFVVPNQVAALPVWLDHLARLASVPVDVPVDVTLLVQGAEAGDAVPAALMGARRVLSNEAPHLRCRLVRLAAGCPDAATRAADEILLPDAEPEVAWTARGRVVPRIRRGLPAPAASDAPLRLSVERPGLLDSLRWEAATPVLPAPGQVAIAVKAAGLNFRDVMWSMGLLPDEALLDGFAGATLGLECAGIITGVGEGVHGFARGDRVMAFAPASLGSHTATAAHAVLRMPDGMDFAAAATIPVAFLTVAYALGHLARLEAGERVLIHGGAGGVGLAAIQYAKHRGAVVYATAGSDTKRALLRRLGVDAVLDSRSLLFADEVMRLTENEGVDVVLNSLSGEAMERSLGILRPFGRFLELGKRDFYGNTAVGLRPFRHNVSYFGIDADQLPLRRPKLAAKLFAEIAALFRDGALRALPHRVMGFGSAVDAFRLMQVSGHIGKVVLVPDGTAPQATPAPAFAARADRTYVVTGGLDGFGLQAARWLAERGARHLALLSRRGPAAPGAEAALAGLAALGAEARAHACDVGDEAALDQVLRTIRQDGPPLAGVVHAAVAMDDALLPQLDAARFARALHPKLAGAAALDRLTRPDAIELFVLFSSVTTELGNPGQANYVAANAGMEAIAERRHADGLPALAVQWGPIGDAGYLARETEVGALLARQLGSAHMTAAEALAALPALLAAGCPVAGLAELRWGGLRGSLPLLATPIFRDLDGGAEPAAEVDLKALLASCPPAEARERLTALLTEEVARIMKLPADKIEPHRPLAELGMDSLMAVEMRLAVEQRFGLTIPVLVLSEGATLAAMAARMLKGLGAEGGAEDTVADAVQDRMARFEDVADTANPDADTVPPPVTPSYAAGATATV